MNEQTAILVVDDDKALRTIWSLHLRKLGYDVDLATNGIDAVTMAQSRRYNLILMDIQMPDMDGLAATYAIRKHEAEAQLPPVPIIGVTAGTTNRESCIAAGMDDYLQKPLSGLELKIVVQQWLLCTAT